MIILKDTYNDRIISRHRTVLAAVRASRAHSRAVERSNGRGHYIPKKIYSESGEDIGEEILCCQLDLDMAK